MVNMSKYLLSFLCMLAISCSVIYAQRDGRYRPQTTAATKKPLFPALGRYTPNQNDGKYYPSEEGKYRGNDDGKYRSSDLGKYTDTNKGSYKPQKTVKAAGATKQNIVPRRKNIATGSNLLKTLSGPQKTSSSSTAPSLPSGRGTSRGGKDYKIVYITNEQEKDGYHFIYETENGILAEEEGHIVDLPSGEGLRTKGYFEYTGDDGSLYRVDYVADDAGFVPQGAHLPPTPPHVIKLLEYLERNAKK